MLEKNVPRQNLDTVIKISDQPIPTLHSSYTIVCASFTPLQHMNSMSLNTYLLYVIMKC